MPLWNFIDKEKESRLSVVIRIRVQRGRMKCAEKVNKDTAVFESSTEILRRYFW
jgi:hypothetical protein